MDQGWYSLAVCFWPEYVRSIATTIIDYIIPHDWLHTEHSYVTSPQIHSTHASVNYSHKHIILKQMIWQILMQIIPTKYHKYILRSHFPSPDSFKTVLQKVTEKNILPWHHPSESHRSNSAVDGGYFYLTQFKWKLIWKPKIQDSKICASWAKPTNDRPNLTNKEDR